MSNFLHDLVQNIFKKSQEYPENNWDYLRYGSLQGPIPFDLDRATGYFLHVLENVAHFEWLYKNLEEQASRELLLDLLAFRVLGGRHVKLALNTENYWREYESIDARFRVQLWVARSWTLDLNLYSVPFRGRTLTVISHPCAIMTFFILQQYFFHSSNVVIQPERGDVVIDAGGCWGDTAVAFAEAVGPEGRVYSFEFVPSNLTLFRDNLARAPDLAARIRIVESPLSNRGGERLHYIDRGPATILANQASGASAVTTTIDDYVREHGLKKVDFIKMDIEGAELAALDGARQTIETFKPKLAISVYHQATDLFTIPQFIKSINPLYRLYLDHYTIFEQETIVYART